MVKVIALLCDYFLPFLSASAIFVSSEAFSASSASPRLKFLVDFNDIHATNLTGDKTLRLGRSANFLSSLSAATTTALDLEDAKITGRLEHVRHKDCRQCENSLRIRDVKFFRH